MLLQGELRTKQNVEELTKLLTNQLRQEQRQRKQTMVQLQAEAAARQQAQVLTCLASTAAAALKHINLLAHLTTRTATCVVKAWTFLRLIGTFICSGNGCSASPQSCGTNVSFVSLIVDSHLLSCLCVQDQLSATRSQLQQLQTNADSLQWLQSTKAKLQAELNNSNTHLQMERQRRSEATLQLQSALADKQRVKDELDALRMQLQQHGLQSSGVESSSAMVQGQLGRDRGHSWCFVAFAMSRAGRASTALMAHLLETATKLNASSLCSLVLFL